MRRAIVSLGLLLSQTRGATVAECGTERLSAERFLHRQARMRRVVDAGGALRALAMPSASNNYDVDGISIIDDADGVVSRRNPFSLGQQALRFTPLPGGGYRLEAGAAFENSGTPLAGLGDDDSRQIALPFAFPFFGGSYNTLFVNADGNLTFDTGDSASSDRSLARFSAGPPRIAPLFSDLDPSRDGASVKLDSNASRVAIIWDSVPVYASTGIGARQTFQVRLFADGAIEFAFSRVSLSGSSAVVGISPGGLRASPDLLSLAASAGRESVNGVAEFFSDADQLDLAAAAQKFYSTHEDSYDYLFFFNALHLYIKNGSVIAFEDTVRNTGQGFGVAPVDDGMIFGSPRRLQAAMNMGPMEQFPNDPYAPMPGRFGTGDTGLSILGHEAGHRFLAWTSVRGDSGADVTLGRGASHWSFNFNSEASLLEGNRLRDDGVGLRPRFTSTAASQAYSPLDQYLFGLRAPTDVPPLFAAVDTDGPAAATAPRVGAAFNGGRFDIDVQDVIKAAGVRLPDAGIAQRHYRFGFVLLKSADAPLPDDLLALAAKYRAQWPAYWNQITAGRSSADIQPARALTVSVWPQAELSAGATLSVSVSITTPLDRDLQITIDAPDGKLQAPPTVTLKAGETAASFDIQALKPGVENVTLRPEDGAFEVIQTRVRVI